MYVLVALISVQCNYSCFHKIKRITEADFSSFRNITVHRRGEKYQALVFIEDTICIGVKYKNHELIIPQSLPIDHPFYDNVSESKKERISAYERPGSKEFDELRDIMELYTGFKLCEMSVSPNDDISVSWYAPIFSCFKWTVLINNSGLLETDFFKYSENVYFNVDLF
jgi:hypothetical protein